MNWLLEYIIIPFFISIAAGIVLASHKRLRNRIWLQATDWYDRIRIYSHLDRVTPYSHLSACDRDILKALHDSDTTLISLRYNDGRPPSIQAKLDRILGIPVACRLIASHHYNESLGRLTGHKLLKGDMRRIYEKPNPEPITTQSYELTIVGHEFIRKHARGLDRGERFIRKWFRGLGKHKYTGCYRDDVGEHKRRELPRLLRGTVRIKKSYLDSAAGAIGTNRDKNQNPDIYEYSQGCHNNGIEWIVAVPFLRREGDTNFDVVQHEDVILLIHTDEWIRNQEEFDANMRRQMLIEQSILTPASSSGVPVISAEIPRAYRPSNKPRRLEFSQELVGLGDTYSIQAKVLGIEEGNDPIVTILKLGESKEFDPSEVL